MSIAYNQEFFRLLEAYCDYKDSGGTSLSARDAKPEGLDRVSLYNHLLDRAPENTAVVEENKNLVHFIESPEFDAQFPRILAKNLFNVRKILFLHIPKSSGTSVEIELQAAVKLMMLPVNLNNTLLLRHCMHLMGTRKDLASVPADQLKSYYLRDIIKHVKAGNRHLTIIKHLQLNYYLNQQLYNPANDIMFSTMRPPIETRISMVNYQLSLAIICPERADGAAAISQNGLAGLDLSQENDCREAAYRIWRKQLEDAKNPMTSFLGGTSLQETLSNVIRHKIFLSAHTNWHHMLTCIVPGHTFSNRFENTIAAASRKSAYYLKSTDLSATDLLLFESLNSLDVTLFQAMKINGIIDYWNEPNATKEGYFQRLLDLHTRVFIAQKIAAPAKPAPPRA